MRRPLVGVPGMWSHRVSGLRSHGVAAAAAVLSAVVRAGGEPVVIFPGSAQPAKERFAFLDGIVLPGGADVDALLYGAVAHEISAVADYAGQDAFDADVIRASMALDVPLLAICRGMQMLNVVQGGTLIQHLDDRQINHVGSTHPIAVKAHSRLAQIVGSPSIIVSSFHHQGVDAIGRELSVVATAPDGVIEAMSHNSAPILAVQWHPEDQAEHEAHDQSLFDWLVSEAAQRRPRNQAVAYS